MTVTNALFLMAENKDSELYGVLNGLAEHRGVKTFPYKVFIQERLASLLFATESWRIKAFDPFKLPSHTPFFETYRNELIACDALKQKYAETADEMYIKAFLFQRNEIIAKFRQKVNANAKAN